MTTTTDAVADPAAQDARIGAYVREHWNEIVDGLAAGVDWYEREAHDEPTADCGSECSDCDDHAMAVTWQDHVDALKALVGRDWEI